ncbi:MAG TPA: T9SS type A sorting domain-containing protein, partial [Flavisolibacter sp.]
IRVDPSGNVFVSGSFSGTATFDPTATLTAPGTNSDRFIQKLDADGNFIWVKQLLNGGCCLDITDIEFDASGNMLSTGYFSGTVDFDPGAGVYSLTVPNPQDLFVWKLDNNGNFIWAKKVDGGASNASGKTCHGDGIDVDAAGNVYVAGDYTGTGSFDFDPGPATYSLNVNGGAMHVLKLDAAGNFVWVAPITTSNGSYAFGYGIQVASDGSVYASCNFSGIVDFDPAKTKYALNAGNGNFAVVKLAQTAKTLKRVNPEITGTPVIRLFPNPARGNVLVELKEARPSVVLNFYDMTGKLVLSQQRQGSSRQWRVDLSTVMSGMYLVEAVAGNEVHRQLLTVQ